MDNCTLLIQNKMGIIHVQRPKLNRFADNFNEILNSLIIFMYGNFIQSIDDKQNTLCVQFKFKTKGGVQSIRM